MIAQCGILHSSSVLCEAGEFQGSYILGDSVYACTSYLMTPLLNPTTQAELNYNTAHKTTKNCIERCSVENKQTETGTIARKNLVCSMFNVQCSNVQ
ncbi:DDE Tnp 4 domain containing protein [Asbolus verrucosus]|uniref:DDE Tnp 4 domain containing protein n=1 Tax=Asbolus verrucosus TaxID=1661398 RepID=A0A482WDC4_ASBVE|nr:DDE Tnp 4 domain containing protein [Asbolus verrucosus]